MASARTCTAIGSDSSRGRPHRPARGIARSVWGTAGRRRAEDPRVDPRFPVGATREPSGVMRHRSALLNRPPRWRGEVRPVSATSANEPLQANEVRVHEHPRDCGHAVSQSFHLPHDVRARQRAEVAPLPQDLMQVVQHDLKSPRAAHGPAKVEFHVRTSQPNIDLDRARCPHRGPPPVHIGPLRAHLLRPRPRAPVNAPRVEPQRCRCARGSEAHRPRAFRPRNRGPPTSCHARHRAARTAYAHATTTQAGGAITLKS